MGTLGRSLESKQLVTSFPFSKMADEVAFQFNYNCEE